MKTAVRRKTSVFYEHEAQSYDEKRFTSDIGRLIDRKQREIVMGLRRETDNLILDVGTGTGRFAIELGKKSDSVVGIDISRHMLMLAKHKSVQARLDGKIQLIRADGHNLPFRSKVFDLCLAINVLNHVEDYLSVIKQIQGALKVNGSLVANFPNLMSPYFPVALLVKFRKQSILDKVYSKWFTFNELMAGFSSLGLAINQVTGFPLPPPALPKTLVPLLDAFMDIFIGSPLKRVSPVLFVSSIKVE